MNAIKRILTTIDNIIEYICMGTLVVLVCLVFMQVFTRYVLHFTPSWSEETCVILMIWLGFITAALGVKRGIHLSINAVVNLMPKSVQNIVFYFDEFAVLFFGIILVRYGGELSAQTMSSIMPATEIPSGFLYACLPTSGILICFYSVIRIIRLALDKNN